MVQYVFTISISQDRFGCFKFITAQQPTCNTITATLNNTLSHVEVRNTTELRYTYNWRNLSDRKENTLVRKTIKFDCPQCFHSELSLLRHSSQKLKKSFLPYSHLIFSLEDRNLAGNVIQSRNNAPFSYGICIFMVLNNYQAIPP